MLDDSKSLDDLEAEDVLALIPAVSEGRRIDYKQAMPSDSEKGVRGFLNDVCALANSAGGFLLYGIDEERDEDGKQTGVPASVCGVEGVNEDKATLDWQQRITQSIEPRIIGHRIRFVGGFDEGRRVMVVYVPRSLFAPHRVTYRGSRDFYIRHDRGNLLMDIGELRSAFVDSQGLAERIADFRRLRLSLILGGEVPVNLPDGYVVAAHIVPLQSLSPDYAGVDVTVPGSSSMPLFYSSPSQRRLNFDGCLLSAYPNAGIANGYVQLFRDGILEIVEAENPKDLPQQAIGYIPSTSFEEGCQKVVSASLALLGQLGVQPPVYICISLARARGLVMARPSRWFTTGSPHIDKDVLVVPPVLAQSLTEDVGKLLRPAFDVVWQASDVDQSPNYDDDGNWIRRR